MITIVYYDENTSLEQLPQIAKQIKDTTGSEVLILPKNFDVLLDCSLDQLISVKGIVDTAVTMKMMSLTDATKC